MARIYYGAGHDDTKSQAELDLLELFEALPNDFTVIHSTPWIVKPDNVGKRGPIGEIDFVIAHPEHGVLVTEVKGGEISIEHRGGKSQWISKARSGREYDIDDPCEQAEDNMHRLLEWVKADRRTRQVEIPLFYAVMLPDSHVTSDIPPNCTQDIVLDMTDVDKLERSLLDVYAYWQKRYPHLSMGGTAAVDALTKLLVPESSLSPKIAMLFERERRKIEQLTEQQFRVLRRMRRFHRAAIVGGAGTGKTMLAIEKAHQLAQADMHVLLLCFNRALAEWIDDHLDDENIVVTTFHGLAGKAIHWAGLSGIPKGDFYEKAADILLDAALVMQAPDFPGRDKLFDAIIVDEAQDFEDEWWIPLPDLLKDRENGIFYVFFDDNQRIYTQISNVPMQEQPFFLDENCRTTQGIHEAMMPYAHIHDDVISLGPDGRPVEHIPAATKKEAKDALRRVLHRLVNEEGVDPDDIVVLTPTRKKSIWEDDEQMGNFILTWDMDTDMSGAIRVTTVYSYKGLEAAVVILTELDKAPDDIRDQLIYVGLSRARNHAIVIGELPEPSTAEEDKAKEAVDSYRTYAKEPRRVNFSA